MRKKHRKIAITVILAFGLFINFSNNIHTEVNKPSIQQGNFLISEDPIIGDH